MVIKFKVIPNSTKNEWVGWFGDDVIKVRLTSSRENSLEALQNFITSDLGIKSNDMRFLQTTNHKLLAINFPDVAFELFWSMIDK